MKIEVKNCGNYILIYTTLAPFHHHLLNLDDRIAVYPPNWWERLLGITYRKKLNRALKRVQRFCELTQEAELEVTKLYESIKNYP